jgi:hypothetical protein
MVFLARRAEHGIFARPPFGAGGFSDGREAPAQVEMVNGRRSLTIGEKPGSGAVSFPRSLTAND